MTVSNALAVLSALLLGAVPSHGDVFSYECTTFPAEGGWTVINEFCDPEQWLESGYLVQHVGLCPESPPPGGQQTDYTRSLEDFEGQQEFFIEWRLEADGDNSEIIGTAPAALVAGSLGAVNYHFTIARDQVRFIRDNSLPILFFDIEPGVSHTYRLELFGAELYELYIDGAIVDSGVPEGAYPSFFPAMNWRSKSWFLDNTVWWDYIRYGVISEAGSGDFDSDGEVDFDDLPFFHECLTTEAGGWAGCEWADMDFDGDTDCDDGQLFVDAWTARADPPCMPTCGDCDPSDFNFDGVVNAADLAILLGAWGPCEKNDPCLPDLSGDGMVNAADLAILLGSWG